ncbi:hypothetical protein [Salinicola rhizosphaerae]|uniref:Uncharacterized protein n=1 Tax=Salinicola rhizosphaerae TaxID=1443141 RepID=A0ABQ3E1W5_9GAMM|nr:hypothetical protein [Salinicola rhizosphaerae]GHB22994.1 hypothetical protein GCM10009038_22520 [Salinicola rhizosphaerae]
MEWLTENSRAISAVTSICTLFVWIFYAQILYRNFARTRRPRIIINRGQGDDLTALCLISNMSSEPIFLEHIIATLHTSQGMYTQDMIDYEAEHQQDEGQQSDGEDGQRSSRYRSSQGPMLSGSFSHIDTFQQILRRLCRTHEIALKGDAPTGELSFQFLDIRVVAIYGSEDHPVGAARRFKLQTMDDGRHTLAPVSLDTKRYANRLQRWRVRQWIRQLDR